MSGQRSRNTENEQILLWVLFFLESLKSLTEKLGQNTMFSSRTAVIRMKDKNKSNILLSKINP
jgi:hypothetical protein